MMANHRLTEIIQSIASEADQHEVDIGEIIASFSRQSFGILLILPCFILIIPPIGAIPGVPFLMGLMIALLSLQLMLGIKQPWVPRAILSIKVETKLLKKSIKGILPVTKKIDAYTKRRLQVLFYFPLINLVAVICFFLSIIIMFIGFIPFLPFMVGIIVLFFGIGLAVADGLFICIGFALTSMLATGIYLIV